MNGVLYFWEQFSDDDELIEINWLYINLGFYVKTCQGIEGQQNKVRQNSFVTHTDNVQIIEKEVFSKETFNWKNV